MELNNTIEIKSGLYVVEHVILDGKVVPVMRPNPNLTEEEFLSRDPYIEMLEKASEEREFQKTVMTQIFVNEYLKSNGLETITEKRAKEGKRDIIGILTADYIRELQKIVFEYARNNNIDLFANKERQSPIIGVMSTTEKQIANLLVQNYTKNQEEKESGLSL